MTLETHPWNVVDHLDTPERMLGYLEAAFEDGDPELIAAALADVAQAKGIEPAAMSSSADVGTLVAAVKALGFELTAKAA